MITEYVDLDTLDICSPFYLQKKHSTYKSVAFTAEELAAINAAPLVEPEVAGDVRTGKALLIGGQYVREYRSHTPEHLIRQAKGVRNNSRNQPLAVDVAAGPGKVFDMDELSRENLAKVERHFEAARAEFVAAGWPDDGSIPWTLADDTDVALTLADFPLIERAGVVREAKAHISYKAAKAAL